MAKYLPIDSEQVARAAEEMIAKHGDSALAQADEQIRTCESEGYGHVAQAAETWNVAETWKLIREVVRDAQQSATTTERYNKALNKGVFLSELFLSAGPIGLSGIHSFRPGSWGVLK